jgi:hypothetical protein
MNYSKPISKKGADFIRQTASGQCFSTGNPAKSRIASLRALADAPQYSQDIDNYEYFLTWAGRVESHDSLFKHAAPNLTPH